MTTLEPTRAWRFMEEIAANMRHEEAVLFPRALAGGAPRDAIDALVRDHDRLRALVRTALVLGLAPGAEHGLPLEARETIDAFARAYDDHVQSESALLGVPTRR